MPRTIHEIMQDEMNAANPLVLDNDFDEVETEYAVQYCQYMEPEYETL